MTLGVKFPDVRLEAYSPEWADAYAAERDRILSAIEDQILGIEHVGSTAIPGLCAKPIIDIAIAVPSLSEAEQLAPAMAGIGYDLAGDGGVPGGRIYGRGPEIRTHLVHAVVAESKAWQDYLNFRDSLIADAEILKKYDSLKRALAHKFGDDRASYTYAKGQFIESVLRGAS